jgi:hypothetical protein
MASETFTIPPVVSILVAAMMDCRIARRNDEALRFADGRARISAWDGARSNGTWASRDYGSTGREPMKRIALASAFALIATAVSAQNFATTRPGKEAWWLRTSFNPMHTEVRGIPVAKIRKDWCKATEFTFDNIPRKLLDEDESEKTMKQYGRSFAVEGNFDRSKTRQTAVVGVYQSCRGQRGSFLLVIDRDTKKIRFVDASPSDAQFAVLAADKGDIVINYCLECGVGGVLRWNAKKKTFGWIRSGHD